MISPETIALVRDRTDIVAVVGEAVPSLKRAGRSFVGLCPFHKEKTPSFHVNPDRGFFHCFGCKESGSAIDFLMKNDGYTFPEAVRALAERAGIPVEETRAPGAVSEADRQKKAREELYAVNQLAAVFFEEQLRTHEHRRYALDELSRRGLAPGTDEKIDEALSAFRIGYAPSGWDGLATFLRAQGVSPVAAETVGLLVPRSSGSGYYDRFRHRLMFAVVDPQGRVVAFSGRALAEVPGASDAKADGGHAPPKYINSPESPVYTKGQMLFGIHQARHAIRHEQSAILVEGNFDVVSLHARGVCNVVAPLGTAFTPEQAKLLKRFAPSVVFVFDGDAAGRKAVRVSRDAVRAGGLSARVAALPDGLDPDELARTKGTKAVSDLVESSKGMLEALIDMALDEGFSQADAYEKHSRVDFVVKLIAEEDDPLIRSMAKSYSDMIAGRLDIVRAGSDAFGALERRIRAQLAAVRAERSRRAAADGPRGPRDARIAPRSPAAVTRKAIVGCLIEWPSLLSDPEVIEELSHLEGPSAVLVACLRRCWNAEERRLDTEEFLAGIDPAYRHYASARMAAPESETQEVAKGRLLEQANTLKRLLLSQEAAQFVSETRRAQGWEAERDFAREVSDRQRAKHGLKG